jgi:hypothetical protein
MIEAGNVVKLLSAVLLLMAVIAWVKLVRGPLLQSKDGRTEMDSVRARSRASYSSGLQV